MNVGRRHWIMNGSITISSFLICESQMKRLSAFDNTVVLAQILLFDVFYPAHLSWAKYTH